MGDQVCRGKKMNSGSSYERFIQEGHEVYATLAKGFSPLVTRQRLKNVEVFYKKALQASGGKNDEKAASYKYLGDVNGFGARKEWGYYQAGSGSGSALLGAQIHLKKCLEFYLKALDHGTLAKNGQPWLGEIENEVLTIVKWSSSRLYSDDSTSFECVLTVLYEIVKSCEAGCQGSRKMGVMLFKNRAEFVFGRGVKSLNSVELSDQDGHDKCLKEMLVCDQLLQRAEELVTRASMDEELVQVKNMKNKVSNYTKLCKAIKIRLQGEELLYSNMIEASDHFKESLRFTEECLDEECLEEKCLENKAITLSRIGKVYSSREIRNMEKAYLYHSQSIKTIKVLRNLKFASSEWYICSSEAMRKHEDEKLKEKISEVELEGKKSPESFLKYLYEKCPHPGKTKQLGSTENMKYTLNKARQVYHPDSNGQQSEDWKVLCEVITKILNAKSEAFRSFR